jgi:TetR/AcrR family transcriptional regulator, repressor of fatR-cypB operon
VSKRAAIFDADDPPSKAAALDAALSLFVQDGIDATSVRDIASRSGFTNPAIFKHFDTKTEMALCLFERCYGWMARHVLAAEDSCAPTDPRARILAIAATMLQLMDEDIEAVLMVQDNLRRFWRRAAPAVRAVSILGRVRGLVMAISPHNPGSQPDDPLPRFLASALIGFLAQIAREFYFNEFDGPASARAPQVRLIIIKLLR